MIAAQRKGKVESESERVKLEETSDSAARRSVG